MNTVIKIIDERIEIETIKERDTDFAKWIHEVRIELLEELRKEISALPSLESKIDTLQRYNVSLDGGEYNHDNGEYVKYSDLLELFEKKI